MAIRRFMCPLLMEDQRLYAYVHRCQGGVSSPGRRSNLAAMTWLLAHQGGWDEVLMFGVPIVLAFLLVRRLERRGRRDVENDAQDEPGSQ